MDSQQTLAWIRCTTCAGVETRLPVISACWARWIGLTLIRRGHCSGVLLTMFIGWIEAFLVSCGIIISRMLMLIWSVSSWEQSLLVVVVRQVYRMVVCWLLSSIVLRYSSELESVATVTRLTDWKWA